MPFLSPRGGTFKYVIGRIRGVFMGSSSLHFKMSPRVDMTPQLYARASYLVHDLFLHNKTLVLFPFVLLKLSTWRNPGHFIPSFWGIGIFFFVFHAKRLIDFGELCLINLLTVQ